jgi:tRNA(His) guanylyltransferase
MKQPVSLDIRMKTYEQTGNTPLTPTLPILARLDGKCFHSFTRGLERPFDESLHALMVATTKHLVTNTCARIGYTQSDEITLLWQADGFDGETFMGGDRSKMISLLAAMTSTHFTYWLGEFIPSKAERIALFDCRVWNVPDRTEAVNCFVWRELDCTRNSIQSAGQAHFSPKQLHGVSCDDIQEMLFQQHSINWNDYPAWAKRGTYVQRRQVDTPFTAEEIDALPPLHDARKNPNLVVSRTEVVELEMPPLTKVINRADVIFDGGQPLTEEIE